MRETITSAGVDEDGLFAARTDVCPYERNRLPRLAPASTAGAAPGPDDLAFAEDATRPD